MHYGVCSFAAAPGASADGCGKGWVGGTLTAVPFSSATATRCGADLRQPAGPVGIAIVAAAALAAGLIYLWNTNEDFRAAVISAWETIKKAGSDLWDWLSKFSWRTFQKRLQPLRSFSGSCLKNIVEYFSTLPERIGYFWGMLLAGIINFGNSALNWVKPKSKNHIGIIQYFSELRARFGNGCCIIGNGAISTWAAESLPGLIEIVGKLPGWGCSTSDMAKGLGRPSLGVGWLRLSFRGR